MHWLIVLALTLIAPPAVTGAVVPSDTFSRVDPILLGDCLHPGALVEVPLARLTPDCPNISGYYRDQRVSPGDVYAGRYNAQIEVHLHDDALLYCGVMNSCHGAGEEQFHRLKIGFPEDPEQSYVLCDQNRLFLFHPQAGTRYDLEVRGDTLTYHRCGFNRDVYDRVLEKMW